MRAPPADNWAPTLPAEDRERYRAAWNAYRSCRDCVHWDYNEADGDGIGACFHPRLSLAACSLTAPEDYTCDDWTGKQNA